MQLHWTPSPVVSALYACWLLERQQSVHDPHLRTQLGEIPAAIARQLAWPELLSRVAEDWPAAEADADSLTESVTEAHRAYLQLYPDLQQQLVWRTGPLREQWEARGPGLMRRISHLSNASLPSDIVPEVLLVQPTVGGAGCLLVDDRRLLFEAMLANPLPELPEVLRLAWLLCQLLTRHRSPIAPPVASLAWIPAVLEAGQEVELCRCDEASLQSAIRHWPAPAPLHPGVRPGGDWLQRWQRYRQQSSSATWPEWLDLPGAD
jgi:hypothetical protein